LTNEELVGLIQAGIDVQENMGQLWEQNRNFIVKTALPFSKSCELEDLIQEAYFGLEKAAQKFDSEMGFKFLTYADHWIRNAIQRYCQFNGNLKEVPISVIEQISKYQKFRSDYQAITGSEPVDEEYCIFLNIKPSKLKELRGYMTEAYTVSIDSPLPGAEDFTLGDTIPDDSCLEDDAIQKQIKVDLWDAVENLQGNQAEVIKRYFQKDESYETIGIQLKISKERVRQLRNKGIKTLRTNRKVKEAAEIFGYGSYRAYHWGVGHFRNTGTSSTEFLALKHIQQQEKQEQIMDQAMDISCVTALTAERMKEKYGRVPVGIQRLQERNAEIDRMIEEYREKMRRRTTE